MNAFASNRIFLLLLVIGGVLGAVVMGSWVAKGNFMNIALILSGIFGALIFLSLGRMYWYMIPLALAAQLPAIPLASKSIDTGELVVVACTAIYIARLAMKKDDLHLVRWTHLPILFSFVWVVIVWTLNPVGVSILGSATLGGRHYFKIVLAFCSFVIVASQAATEKDFFRCMVLVTLGSAGNTAYGLFSYFFGGGAEMMMTSGAGEGYTWHQILVQPTILISSLIFARFKPSEVIGFQRPGILFLYALTIFLALLSGKRAGLAAVLMAPVISAILYREYRFALILSALGAACVFALVAGHGSLYSLPFPAQRALSWLPGDWDPSLAHFKGGSDIFREELRKLAVDEIKLNPVIGKGYAMEYNEMVAAQGLLQFGTKSEDQYMYYAIGKSWHNRWLGYAADFGIPFSVLLGFIYLVGLGVSFRLSRILPHPSGRQVFAIFAFMWILRNVLNSHTSGHTALDALYDWWLYGLLFALLAATKTRNWKPAQDVFPGRSEAAPLPGV